MEDGVVEVVIVSADFFGLHFLELGCDCAYLST